MAYLRCPQCQLMVDSGAQVPDPTHCPRCRVRLVSVPGPELPGAREDPGLADEVASPLERVGQGVTPSTTRQERSPMHPPDQEDP